MDEMSVFLSVFLEYVLETKVVDTEMIEIVLGISCV